MQAIGLLPGAADGSWQQPFDLIGVTAAQPDEWVFSNKEKSLTLKQWDQFVVSSGVQSERAVIDDAEIVFVGYGIQAPEYDWDDFKGQDLTGKVLLIMNNDPDWDPELFAGDAMEARAKALADKTFELVSFLTDIMGVTRVEATYDGTVTYHDACAGLRELAIKDQPRKLLASVDGLRLEEMADTDTCCGFGGAFCVKYPEISNAMVGDKTDAIAKTGADLVLAGDLGCLMNIAGKLARVNSPIAARHVAEVLAGMTDAPAIAAPDKP